MVRRGRIASLSFIAAAVLGAIVPGLRPPTHANSSEHASSARPPTLVFSTSKRKQHLASPIELEWTIRNSGRGEISLLLPTDSMRVIDAVRVGIEVLRPDGRTFVVENEMRRSMGPRREELDFVSLPAGRSVSGAFVLEERSTWIVVSDSQVVRRGRTESFSPEMWVLSSCFEEPGKYELRLRVQVADMSLFVSEDDRPRNFWSGTLTAGPIALVILPRKPLPPPTTPR